MAGDQNLPDFCEESEFGGTNSLVGVAASPDDIFSILEALEGTSSADFYTTTPLDDDGSLLFKEDGEEETEEETSRTKTAARRVVCQRSTSLKKRRKMAGPTATASCSEEEAKQVEDGGEQRMSHITVERNRRKQMNENLSVLRSLMPCFYVKRGDQASIIGGVVDYINELQTLVQSLEAKKQRKVVYNEVLSPRLVVNSSSTSSSSPRPSPLSPRNKLPPVSPRLSLPISPRTPQPQSNSPYKPRLHPAGATALEPFPATATSSSTNSSIIIDNNNSIVNELVANSKSALAEVEVKFSGPNNLILKTVSPRVSGQAMKIISALDDLCLEILHVSVSTVDDTMVNSFTIKIGIECQLSAEELAHQIQQTFC